MNEHTPFEVRVAARRAVNLPDAVLLAECREEFFNAGGPGGQHRNKAETAVRLTHVPTHVTVTATERRSQAQNRGAALWRLRETLAALAVEPKKRRPTKPTKGSQRRRLEAKRQLSQKKQQRRGDD